MSWSVSLGSLKPRDSLNNQTTDAVHQQTDGQTTETTDQSFARFGLDEKLVWAVEDIGFRQATEIQDRAIPVLLKGRDMVACARTGTGKTAAFGLPLLHHIRHEKSKSRLPHALILTPTRELCLQVQKNLTEYSRYLPLKIIPVIGGVGMGGQVSDLRKGADVVVATPGRLLDLAEQRAIEFSAIRFLVLDEADRMLDMGFIPDVKRIISKLPAERQSLMFSATMPPVIRELARQFMKEPEYLDVARHGERAETVEHSLWPVPAHLKKQLLLKILEQYGTDGTFIIFARTRNRTNEVFRAIERTGVPVVKLHSDCTQSERNAALDAFREGKIRILVATDVASRGLDVEGISHVINYDVPTQAEDYVHRIGRTGRAFSTGEAFTLCQPSEESLLRGVEALLNEKIPVRTLEGFNYSAPPTPGFWDDLPVVGGGITGATKTFRPRR